MKVGTIQALYRYPIKSMAGESIERARLGWHGIHGDRRLAMRLRGEQGGFPWLTATKLAELLRYSPVCLEEGDAGAMPTHVRTPSGDDLPLFSKELEEEIGGLHGSPVTMTHLDRGIFDEASISAITSATIDALADMAGHEGDVRRFRPNLLISADNAEAFEEDCWVGGILSFGEGDHAATIAVTNWDVRCSLINLHPDTGQVNPAVLKTVVRERKNQAGIYATVLREGNLHVGQAIYFKRP